MSEEIGDISQGVVTPEPHETHQGEQPNTPESAPDTNTEADAAAQPDEDHKVPKGVQKRIDRLTRERYRLQGELEAMRRQPPQPAVQAQPERSQDGTPKPEQFASYEAFLEAKAEWKAEQKVTEVLQRQQESTRQQTVRQRQAEMQQSWDKQIDAAADIYDDFEEVALSPDVPVSGAMAEAIQLAEKGADVLYYLGKNREEAAKIARMDPLRAAVAIGRIEATLARPTPKKTTNAPAPISPVGARAAVTKDPSKMTDAEFSAWRREQIKRRG
jgi:hypothetical protein